MLTAKQLSEIASVLRRDSLEATTAAGSGHASSCLSAADIASVLFFHEMALDKNNPYNPDNDEFILSKGHAAPLLYSALRRAGLTTQDPNTLRKSDSPLEGHPIPSLDMPWIKVATGSLGQGLSVGIGMAYAAKLQKRSCKTYVLMGDSETSEGSVWEAAQIAPHYKLNNLCAIVDVNKLGQRGETMLSHDVEAHAQRWGAFGWQAIVVNGHSIPDLLKAFAKTRNSKKPSIIIAKTVKGKGVSIMENKNGWHGKALSQIDLKKALKELPDASMPQFELLAPTQTTTKPRKPQTLSLPRYTIGEEVATREAYGATLAALAQSDPSIMALDAEVSNSTFAEKVKQAMPDQFIECFIAEQNMMSMAQGLAVKGYKPFTSSFAAFLTRAHDQLRMISLSRTSLTVCGSHAGISIGEDGSSQMGLDDIAMFRALPSSMVLQPADANSAVKLTQLTSQHQGISYIRTLRPKMPVLYASSEEFTPGEFKVLKSSGFDSVVLLGSGVTTHESLKAFQLLHKQGIPAAVVDCYSIKPFNSPRFAEFVRAHGSKLIIAEDHFQEGGIGEMLSHALANTGIKIKHLSVNSRPHSATKDQLLEAKHINAKAIAQAATELVRAH